MAKLTILYVNSIARVTYDMAIHELMGVKGSKQQEAWTHLDDRHCAFETNSQDVLAGTIVNA